MKLLTRDTDYAVRALCYISRHTDSAVSAHELVECLKVPRPFIRKILQRLNKKGILSSRKGLGGGFELAMPAHKISIAAIIEAFQGSISFSDHQFKKELCHEVNRCPMKKMLNKIESYVTAQFSRITIASLMKEGEKTSWQSAAL